MAILSFVSVTSVKAVVTVASLVVSAYVAAKNAKKDG